MSSDKYRDWSKERLIKKLQDVDAANESDLKRKSFFASLIWKLSAGKALNKSLHQLLQEIKKREVPKLETISDLAAAVFTRFTRIGIFAIIVAVLPTILLIQQNSILRIQTKLFGIQNQKIEQQLFVEEAARRANLIFELTAILDKMDVELKAEKNKDRALSNNLIGRIIALSRSFRPYRFLDDHGALIPRPLSPERAQLLISLSKAELAYPTLEHIYNDGDFTFSDLKGANLSQAYLRNIDLSGANLVGADLSNANLESAQLLGAAFGPIVTSPIEITIGKKQFNNSNNYFSNTNLKDIELFESIVSGTTWLADLNRVSLNLDTSRYNIQKGRISEFSDSIVFKVGKVMVKGAPTFR